MGRRIVAGVASAVVCAGVSFLINHYFQERYRRITIGRDTTYVSRPVFADGYVDYLGALNERFSAGVTPENNAAVPVYLATDPKDFYVGPILEAYRAGLGVMDRPDPSSTYADFESFMFDRELATATQPDAIRRDEESLKQAWGDEVGRRAQGAWTREQDPEVAAWLERIAPALRLAAEASRRERFYMPMIGKPGLGTTLDAYIGNLGVVRGLSNALVVRSGLALAGRDYAAWRGDFLAQQRLGRLLMHTPTMIQGLIGMAIVEHANDQLASVLGTLTEGQAREVLADLRGLPALPDLVDCDDQCQRLEMIAEISCMARFGPAAADMDQGDFSVPLPKPASFGFQPPIHFDDLLRQYNQLYDRRIGALRQPSYSRRCRALDDFFAERRVADARTASSNSTAAIMMLTSTAVLSSTSYADGQDKAREMARLTRLGLLLVIYRADHGAYPATLAELREVQSADRDIFTDDAPVHYVPGEALIYSVGPNQRDDKGVYVAPKVSVSALFASGRSARSPEFPDDIAVHLP